MRPDETSSGDLRPAVGDEVLAMGGRTIGLLLMAIAVAAFLGTTSETLPAAVFFPALLLFGVGAFRFVKSNSEALVEADRRTEARLRPVIRDDRAALAAAERRATRRGEALNALNTQAEVASQRLGHASPGGPAASASTAGRRALTPVTAPERDAIELDQEVEASEAPLVVTTDVSFPLEVQRGDALADQLRKLNHLLTQGILTEAEYAIAKAKLLS